MRLYLIAGHGDGDPGACANGYTEAALVRQLCERVKALGGDSVIYLDPSNDWYRTGGISTYPFEGGAQVLECHLDSASASARGGHIIVKAGGGTDAPTTRPWRHPWRPCSPDARRASYTATTWPTSTARPRGAT